MLEWDFEEKVEAQSSIQIFDCEQGTPEWFECRLGIPTASMFSAIMAGGEGDTRKTYMYKLLGERLTGELQDSINTKHMERGKIMEDEARNVYAVITDLDPKKIGFVRNGDKGCSPDSIIDTNGLLEIKTKLPHLQIPVLLNEHSLPSEHKAQVMGQIWVTEREWCDFVSYCPNLPPFIHRCYRDEAYIKLLSDRMDKFLDELDQLEHKLRLMYP